MSTIAERLDALRAAIEAEDISYGEIAELQSLAISTRVTRCCSNGPGCPSFPSPCSATTRST